MKIMMSRLMLMMFIQYIVQRLILPLRKESVEVG